ncbi:efflux RND transporter periplasmic adaptor subunit [Ectothiorhodospira lacustris]|uniref:efflux RND transporter periplasmic adaptor subunit n=1 Tax=Ectothiorhodospira lacustris TaxID=2899127 RepID=UPI001EE8442E|nr:efflux RND transporter periplasmic adaptor subunit [Ectothiorhodospira lacustris]MCG5502177.1 efflux RND transporter periplasmic adaptor subunit [Ectothiorhodospira lacustris]
MIHSGLHRLLAGMLIFWAASALAGPDPVTVTATRHVLPAEQVFDGRVEAVQQATVSAQTSGRVMEVLYDVDDFVDAGSIIIRLRDTEQRARLDQAEAGLREAQARFNEARAEFERAQGIFERQLISRAEMDRVTATLEAARARLESARAARAGAQEALEHALVRAPYAGIVTQRHVEVGESVSPGQPLLSGISLEFLRVTTQVPQRFINPVRRHQTARILLEDQPAVVVERLTFFPYADPATGSFRVRAELPDRTPGLFPGMFVKVAFTVGERETLLVPAAAVLQRSEVSAVYVVDDQGRISLRQVRTGRTEGDGQVAILAGLSEGEQVALDPVVAGVALKTRQREAAR